MLVGVWGPFAIGKTTYISAYQANHKGDAYKHVSFVYADLSLEYHWSVKQQRWVDKQCKGEEDHWKGKQACKEAFIDDMVADDRRLWIVESARYFSGMYECLVEVFQRYDGGMAFIIPTTDGATMKAFMQARCEGRGKTFREDYWDDRRVEYEAGARYLNAADKWFQPNKIPFTALHIDSGRSQFSGVGMALDSYIKRPVSKWYGVAERWQADMDRVDGRRARR